MNQPLHSPLQHLFEGDDLAEFVDWNGLPVVSTFGYPQAEYAALRRGAGLLDLPQRAVLEVTGADRHAFLNNLLTNGLVGADKRPLPPGHGCLSFFLNLKGRIVAEVRVLEHPSGQSTWIETDRLLVPALQENWGLYLFAEKVRLHDRSADLHVMALHGPEAVNLLREAGDVAVGFEARPEGFPATADLPCAVVRIGGVEVLAARHDQCGVPGVVLMTPRDDAERLWSDLVTRFGATGDDREFGRRRLRPVGWAMFNAARIEGGTPLLGIDFPSAEPSTPATPTTPTTATTPTTPTTSTTAPHAAAEAADPTANPSSSPPKPNPGLLPAETGPLFQQAVSVTAGCYLGQEVVARMHARGQVARRIVGVRMDEDALPTAGAPVEIADQQVGIVTSSTLSPLLSNAPICLALLKRPHFEEGTELTIPAEGRHARGRVVPLPFIAPAAEA